MSTGTNGSGDHPDGMDPVAAQAELEERLTARHRLLTSDAPEEILELSTACIDYVRQAVGVEPDGTADTLPLVDHYLRQARSVVAERPELEPLVVRSVGAYFGELVRPLIRGFWRRPSAQPEDWEVCSAIAYLAVNPMGVVYEALHDGSHGGPSGRLRLAPEDEASVKERLEALPEVPEDEFFLLSTRLEALEVVAEALRITAERDGVEDIRFEAEDYEDDEA